MMKIISIILLLSFTAYAAQDSLSVFLTPFYQHTGNIKMVVNHNTKLDSMRQVVNYNNIPKKIAYILPYVMDDHLEVIGSSKKSTKGLNEDHEEAIINARRNALIFLGINTDYMSDASINSVVSDIFMNKYYITKIGYSSDSTYQVLLSGKLDSSKVLQYYDQKHSKKASTGTHIVILGIVGILLFVIIGKKAEEMVKRK